MFEYWIIGLSIIGLFLSLYIYRKKTKHQTLTCVIGNDCNKVINSKYGTTFGMENTLLGALYFTAILALTVLKLTTTLLYLNTITTIVTSLAALFSIYLLYVQLKILKELCEYCLFSALISIALFILTVA